tara:strand:+ start:66 stop:269 length:204 start_codon:yes stop_codon:yes gene_type:complete
MSLEVIMLKSVGSCIDKTGMTYPLQVDGTPDMNMGCHIEDIENDEWFESLSDEDNALLLKHKFVEKN